MWMSPCKARSSPGGSPTGPCLIPVIYGDKFPHIMPREADNTGVASGPFTSRSSSHGDGALRPSQITTTRYIHGETTNYLYT
ncbi:hypothetical protein MTP99_000872 [Tenebrio molitor]|nr:hypothetical protein MTP99_000872 [Tenebrio molitor]